jgi:superfamily I DNA and/or RNA helicase
MEMHDASPFLHPVPGVFVIDKHRLNVAISRAQSLAIVVANSRLIQNFNGSLGDMAPVNLFAKVMGESAG